MSPQPRIRMKGQIMFALKPLFDIIFGLEGFEATAFWIALFVAYMIAGFFIDMLMQKQGFGPYWNSVLAILGTFVGLYARYNYLPEYKVHFYEPYVTVGSIAGGVALTMITLAFVRNRTS